MAHPAWSQKKNGKYLWFALLGMGFEPDKNNTKHNILGPNMFDKPNKDAFHSVIHFLLEKLNPTRFRDAYRHCWPSTNHKTDAEFRKVTCSWLREVMDESSNAGSKVVASLFLSPGGPRFTNLMLDVAKHVMLQEMKSFTTNDTWVPGAAAMPASCLDIAVKRRKLILKRFLKTAVDQDCLLQDYQRQAHLVAKSVKDLRAENAKYDELLKRQSTICAQGGFSPAEKSEIVRGLWSAVDGMLSVIKNEQDAVDCVLKGDVDQYVLDGSNCTLKIPSVLQETIERLPDQLSAGKVYEGDELNLLCVLELSNHALKLLRNERCRLECAPAAQLCPQLLQEKCQQMTHVLQDLKLLRQRISKEEIPEVERAVGELELEWNKKWTDTLGKMPLLSFLNDDPALEFLSPMATLSFKASSEAVHKHGIFSQYQAKLLEEKPMHNISLRGVSTSYCLKSPVSAMAETMEIEASTRANTSLDWLFDASPSPPKTPSVPQIQVNVKKTTHTQLKSASTKKETQILDLECDNLASQFAEAVTTTTPTEGRIKGLDLGDLLVTLRGDPFSTRKQLPRTPESLIMDVKSSWRKAMEEDEAEKSRLSASCDDGIIEHLTPVGESQSGFVSPLNEADPRTVDSDATPAATCQTLPICQEAEMMLKSSLSWDVSNMESDSPSGTGSSAVHFSLDHEMLPEISDSLLSLDTEAVDLDDDDHLIPLIDAGQTVMNTTPPAVHQNLCNETATPEEDKVAMFSLDLCSLESPSEQRDYSLPKLISISPIDDLKF